MSKTFPPLPPFWPELRFYSEIDSSNAELRRLDEINDARHGSAVIAQYQYAGKGQQGSVWEGNEGENLYLSLFLHPKINAQLQFLFNMRISQIIAQTLQKFNAAVQIKWPNDLILNNKKIGGLLIENSLSSSTISKSIIGLGINVNQTSFKNLANASSLAKELGREISIEALRDMILENLAIQLCKASTEEKIHSAYHALLWKKNQLSTFEADGIIFNAIVEGSDEFGRLILSTPEGNKYFNVKEISWKSW